MRGALELLPAATRARASLQIVSQLVALKAFSEAEAIALYAPLPGEVDVGELLRARFAEGAPLWLPRMRADGALDFVAVGSMGELRQVRHGIREPRPDLPATPIAELDLLVLPGLAFDRRGVRLGRGGGFYDRSLGGASRDSRPRLVGVAFGCQRVERLPAAPHDLRVDTLVTEHGAEDSR